MENLVEQYLFQYKKCPLPSVGALQIKEGSAIAWHGDNKLSAPVPFIEFTQAEIPADHFVAFIAAKKNIPVKEASVSLQKFCTILQKLDSFGEINLHNAGKFYLDPNGTLVFKEETLPKAFFPSIPFQRVSHTKVASHTIIVGDTETTSEVMTEYYSEKEIVKMENWWIGALIITVIAAAALAFYFQDHKPSDNFGNTRTIETTSSQQTYKIN